MTKIAELVEEVRLIARRFQQAYMAQGLRGGRSAADIGRDLNISKQAAAQLAAECREGGYLDEE